MVFSSVSFLFLFLPIVLLLYHGFFFLPVHLGRPSPLSFRLSNAFLLLVSVIFYSGVNATWWCCFSRPRPPISPPHF